MLLTGKRLVICRFSVVFFVYLGLVGSLVNRSIANLDKLPDKSVTTNGLLKLFSSKSLTLFILGVPFSTFLHVCAECGITKYHVIFVSVSKLATTFNHIFHNLVLTKSVRLLLTKIWTFARIRVPFIAVYWGGHYSRALNGRVCACVGSGVWCMCVTYIKKKLLYAVYLIKRMCCWIMVYV